MNKYLRILLVAVILAIGSSVQAQKKLWTAESLSSGQTSIATDGEFIYTSSSNKNGMFYKYDSETREFIEQFQIDGVPELYDFAFDGSYFYAGTYDGYGNDHTIYVLDLKNKSLVREIVVPNLCGEGEIIEDPIFFMSGRHMCYDPNANDGKGGLWFGDWSILVLIDLEGNVLDNRGRNLGVEVVNPESGDLEKVYINCYGSIYDDYTSSEPCLWFTDYENRMMIQYIISTGEFSEAISLSDLDVLQAESGYAAGIERYENKQTGKVEILGAEAGTGAGLYSFQHATFLEPGAPDITNFNVAMMTWSEPHKGSISMQVPSKAQDGSDLTGTTMKLEIFVDGELYYEADAVEAGSWSAIPTENREFELTEFREYRVTVKATNEAGESNLPEVVLNHQYTAPKELQGFEVRSEPYRILWKGVTGSQNGGISDLEKYSITSYVVVRSDGKKWNLNPEDILAEEEFGKDWLTGDPKMEMVYVFKDEMITQTDVYSYTVYGENELGKTAPETTSSELFTVDGTIFYEPFTAGNLSNFQISNPEIWWVEDDRGLIMEGNYLIYSADDGNTDESVIFKVNTEGLSEVLLSFDYDVILDGDDPFNTKIYISDNMEDWTLLKDEVYEESESSSESILVKAKVGGELAFKFEVPKNSYGLGDWGIDNIRVSRNLKDAQICHHSMPSKVEKGIHKPSIVVKNLGAEEMTFHARFTVMEGDSEIFSSEKEVSSLAFNKQKTVVFDEWDAKVGNYTLKFDIDEDEIIINNSVDTEVEVVEKANYEMMSFIYSNEGNIFNPIYKYKSFTFHLDAVNDFEINEISQPTYSSIRGATYINDGTCRQALAYDLERRCLYNVGVDGDLRQIGQSNQELIMNIAYDNATGKIYATKISGNDASLIEIDRYTGDLTYIGKIGNPSNIYFGLVALPDGDLLSLELVMEDGTYAGTTNICRINKQNAAVETITTTGVKLNSCDLAYNDDKNTLIVVGYKGSVMESHVIEINLEDGEEISRQVLKDGIAVTSVIRPYEYVERDVAFTSFSLLKEFNEQLPFDYFAEIDNSNKTVAIHIESEDQIDISELIPSFKLSADVAVYITNDQQVSSETEVDFTEPVTYILRGYGREEEWTVTLNYVLGVEDDLTVASDVEVFPNPTSDFITISKGEEVEIYNMSGQLMFKQDLTGADQINISGFKNGVYILKIKTGNENHVTRIVKM